MMRKMPADPDGMNEKRALFARAAINEFIKQTKCSPADAMGDLLCNLMHMSDRESAASFSAALAWALGQYAQETEELT